MDDGFLHFMPYGVSFATSGANASFIFVNFILVSIRPQFRFCDFLDCVYALRFCLCLTPFFFCRPRRGNGRGVESVGVCARWRDKLESRSLDQ